VITQTAAEYQNVFGYNRRIINYLVIYFEKKTESFQKKDVHRQFFSKQCLTAAFHDSSVINSFNLTLTDQYLHFGQC